VDRAITITVGEANVGPTLTDPGNQSLNELATLAFSLAGADVDVIGGVAQGFTYSIQSGSQTGMSLNPTSGAFSWTPTEAQDGSYPVTFRVTDAAGSTAGRTLTITVGEVNVTPTLADPGNQSINESAVLNFTLVGADPDVIGGVAQTFTYSIATGLQLGMSLNSSSGLFAWIPTETQDGSYPVTLRVTDAAGATSNRMITLTVGEVNVSPTLANPGNHSVNELATLSITLSGSDSDIIGGVPQGLTYSIQSGSQTGMSLNSSTGAFFWTPTESQDGIYPVNFRVTDAAGSTADRAVTLTVGEANVSPTLADPGNRFVNEGSTLSFTLLGSDADVIGSVPQAFAYSIAGGLQAGMSLNPVSGSFAWSPTESQDGNYSVTFRITDAAGATADRNVAITVGEVDALPTLTGPGNQVVNELSTLNFTLFGSDPDVVAGVVQSRTYGITSGAQPGMSLNATTGAFNWTPTEGQDGVYRITVRVSDGALEALASFFITVHEVNTPPTLLGPGNVSGRVDAAVEFTVSATDPDRVGGLPENLTYSIVSGGRPGMVLDSISGQFRWTPTNEQSGVTFMTIRAQDAAGGSSTISVTLNIAGPILPPVIPLPRFRLPTGFAVTPTGLSGAVSVHQATEAATFSIDPISPAPPGGIRVAMADFNGDGTDDVVVGTGPGGSSHLRILDGKNRSELFRLDPFEAAFTGGIFVAAGDVTGDGVADLIITPDEGGGPRIRIFDGTNFLQLADFFGIDDPAFRGGARAAVGDLNGDGTGDLIVAAGFGGGPRVAGFDGKSLTQDLKVKLFGDFLAFEEGLRNGIYVAVGDIDGDGDDRAELIAGGGPGGGPRVSSFAGTSLVSGATPQRVVDFFAGAPTNRGGVRVATKDLDGDANADLIVGAGPGSASRVTAYTGKALRSNLTPSELFAFDPAPGFSGGVFVG